jgi:hypothetical protein
VVHDGETLGENSWLKSIWKGFTVNPAWRDSVDNKK